MQYPNFGIFSTQKGKASQAPSFCQFKMTETAGIWLNKITRRLTIRQKIVYGYILSISIAILGTGAGLVVGEHYDDQARDQFRIAQERYQQINQLEKTVWLVKLRYQQLMVAAEKKALQPSIIYQLQESISQADEQLSKLQITAKDYHNFPEDHEFNLKTFLQTCDREVDAYTRLLQLLLQKVSLPNPTLQDIRVKEQILQEITNGNQATRVDKLSNTLDRLVQSIVEQEKQAETIFRKAKVSRLIIIIVSMGLSVTIALAIAFHTSSAIARPIKAVTKVAKQATQEGNYELQAPVTSDDEIGVLATSLNQLIQQVSAQFRELKQTQAQLIQGEKMSSLGQMVAGLAHEINNPVNFIYANLDHAHNYTQDLLDIINLYQQHYPQPVSEITTKIEEVELDFISDDLPKLLSSMHTGTERIRQIILSLRNFCHLDEAEMKQVDIHAGLDNTLLILNHRINRGVQVIKQYESLPLIECYPAQLNQVFWHIISNAVDELTIYKKCINPQISIETRLINPNEIEVRIRDNGQGICPTIKDKIFDPFFTTKPVGEGTGMGLAICYQVVEKHRGKIQVNSELGQGTEFVVTLPRTKLR